MYAKLEVSIALDPSSKSQWDFWTGFWIIAENARLHDFNVTTTKLPTTVYYTQYRD